jgi:hypothetical protein
LALFAAWFLLSRKVDRLDEALGRELARVEKLDALLEGSNADIDASYRRIEEARIRRESAARRIKEAESVASAAAEERSAAEDLTQEALERERLAREQAEEARRRAEAERRRREEEWSRLGRALGKVAPTRRDGDVLTADLGPGFVADKEKISRLAGILLAHHGYRAMVEGEGAEAAVAYLTSAGLPGDIVASGGETGRLRLVVRDQILADSP